MITIDGSRGEGGGQIIRTALALSLIAGKPFSISNIRAGRKRPGLLRQHLTAVNAAAEIGSARLEGNRLGSRNLVFEPGTVQGGDYCFDIGSAGSCTLVLQTVLPALALADSASRVCLRGGTHNPYAPPFDFLEQAFLPVLNRMGPHVTLELKRPGFYPAGGGELLATIEPVSQLSGLDLAERGTLVSQSARAQVANLPKSIADREMMVVRKALRMRKSEAKSVELQNSHGPGNVVLITLQSECVTEVMTGFGRRGVRAEAVAQQAVKEVQQYLASGAAAGPYLADQLLLPWALARSGQFSMMPPTDHTVTNRSVIQEFLDVSLQFTERPDGTYLCIVEEH